MPMRVAPTARQQRLGHELRRLREKSGMSATQAGALFGVGQSRVSNIEIGRLGVSPERVRTFAHNYGCSDPKLIDALADMAGGRSRAWWEDYRERLPAGLLDLAELEHHATGIRTAQTTHLPGLLQTVDYARVVFNQTIPELPPPEVEYRVSHRIKRQEVLYGTASTPYLGLIHEAALRMQFGGADVTKSQLRHIVEMSKRDNITVRVVPFRAGVFPGAGQTIVFAEGPVPELDAVQLDAEHGSAIVHTEVALMKYRAVLAQMEAIALKPAQSRTFINSMVSEL